MTQQQAEQLIAHIQSETGHVQTRIKRVCKGESGYAVVAVLRRLHRRVALLSKADWLSLKQAWQWWLPDVEIVEEKKPDRYLIDGIPMRVFLGQDGYWRGDYRDEKQQRCRKCLGTSDPRKRYPVYHQESEDAS